MLEKMRAMTRKGASVVVMMIAMKKNYNASESIWHQSVDSDSVILHSFDISSLHRRLDVMQEVFPIFA
jgi:hypothetical protein